MEKRIGTIVDEYNITFKHAICNQLQQMEQTDDIKLLVDFVYNYERLTLTQNDFAKRKRTKNEVAIEDRCIAKRCNGEQCTRRKKNMMIFCGTHVKGAPHGNIHGGEPP
jgi:hypothetical protein